MQNKSGGDRSTSNYTTFFCQRPIWAKLVTKLETDIFPTVSRN